MAIPLMNKKIVKKRVKKFKRPQSDRRITVKVLSLHSSVCLFSLALQHHTSKKGKRVFGFV
jgi:hypothetical protein